jgi:hypothetical protein
MHLIITANYEDREFEGIIVKRGQRVASFNTLAQELNLTPKIIRTALNNLKRANEVASVSTSKYTVFTVVNYDKYQYSGQAFGQTKGKRRANGGQQCNKDKQRYNKDKQYSSSTVRLPHGQLPMGEVHINEGGDF